LTLQTDDDGRSIRATVSAVANEKEETKTNKRQCPLNSVQVQDATL